MSRGQLISTLLKLDPRLATQILKNDKLTAKLKTDALLKELNLQVTPNTNRL